MTEFFQPMTHVRADWKYVSYVVRYGTSTAGAAHHRGTNSKSEIIMDTYYIHYDQTE